MPPPLLEPEPELPPELEPGAAVAVVEARVVPLTEVFALDPVVPPLLAALRVVGVALAFEDVESAEVELTAEAPFVVLTLLLARADVAEAGEETPAVAEAVSSAFPGDAEAPAPAPEEEPPVFAPPADEDEPDVAADCT